MFKGKITVLLVAALLLGSVSPALATPLFGTSFGGLERAVLYDVNAQTGLATNPRPTGIDHLVGIAFSPGGTLYGLSNAAAAENPNSLFTIDPETGASSLIDAIGLDNVVEGDLAFDPTTSVLYGLYNLDSGQRQLLTIDTDTAAATVIPGSLTGDPSGMAFDSTGMLYALDTSLRQLLTVDKTTGAILTTTALSAALGSVAGMDVDPATGTLYVADGESDGTDTLYTLNPTTGVLTEVGPTGLPDGLAGLAFVPEPTTLVLMMLGGAALMRRRMRQEKT